MQNTNRTLTDSDDERSRVSQEVPPDPSRPGRADPLDERVERRGSLFRIQKEHGWLFLETLCGSVCGGHVRPGCDESWPLLICRNASRCLAW